MIKKVILDTNFLLIPFQFRVDIFSEIRRVCDFNYSLCILDKTEDELNRIAEREKGKARERAKLALKLIRIKKIKKIKTEEEGSVDDLLLKQDAVIATQDRELVKRLKGRRLRVIQLRQKKYLIIK